MFKILMTACAFVLAASSSRAGTEIAFADVPWGSSAATITARMLERGFKLVRIDQDGDLQFNGTIDGEPAGVVAIRTSDDKLVKWMVVMAPPDTRALEYYRRLKRELTQRYGDARIDREDWEYPYAGGEHVGHEEVAIRVGKGVLRSAWATNKALPAVVVEVTDRLIVTAAYEGPGWNEEADRRRTEGVAASRR